MTSYARLAAVSSLALVLAMSAARPGLAWECPQTQVAQTCIGDPEGLCGKECFVAIRDAALKRADDYEIPCGDGLDDVVDLLKGCMKSQAGLEWNDCGGMATQKIEDFADKIKCEGGGTLKDKIDGGGGGGDDGGDDEGEGEREEE